MRLRRLATHQLMALVRGNHNLGAAELAIQPARARQLEVAAPKLHQRAALHRTDARVQRVNRHVLVLVLHARKRELLLVLSQLHAHHTRSVLRRNAMHLPLAHPHRRRKAQVEATREVTQQRRALREPRARHVHQRATGGRTLARLQCQHLDLGQELKLNAIRAVVLSIHRHLNTNVASNRGLWRHALKHPRQHLVRHDDCIAKSACSRDAHDQVLTLYCHGGAAHSWSIEWLYCPHDSRLHVGVLHCPFQEGLVDLDLHVNHFG